MEIENTLGHLPVNALVAALINNQTSLPKIKLIEVATTSNPYFEETPHDIDAETILKTLVELDDEGDPAIRIGFHTTTGSTKLAVSELSEIQLLRMCIGKTSDGKPYLRATIQSL